jgi:hypothetical protein
LVAIYDLYRLFNFLVKNRLLIGFDKIILVLILIGIIGDIGKIFGDVAIINFVIRA